MIGLFIEVVDDEAAAQLGAVEVDNVAAANQYQLVEVAYVDADAYNAYNQDQIIE